MRYVMILIAVGLFACSAAPAVKDAPLNPAPTEICAKCDPMTAAQAWCQNVKDVAGSPVVRPIVLRLVRINATTYEAIVGIADDAESDAERLVIVYKDGWVVDQITPAKSDAYWPGI